MGKKAWLMASYGPSYYPVVPKCFTMERYSRIFIEFAILMSFGAVMAKTSPVSIQQCEKDFNNFIGCSEKQFETFWYQNIQSPI